MKECCQEILRVENPDDDLETVDGVWSAVQKNLLIFQILVSENIIMNFVPSALNF